VIPIPENVANSKIVEPCFIYLSQNTGTGTTCPIIKLELNLNL
jgi:hypothetical protein